jgi:hypothetical protein
MQTTVAPMQPGFPGLVADAELRKSIASRVNTGTASLPFGVMAAEGATVNGCAKATSQNDVPAGIVAHSHAYARDIELDAVGLEQNVTVGVLRQGPIWVVVEGTTPTKADHVHVRMVATGGQVSGAFRTTADASTHTTIDISAFAHWTGRVGTGCAEVDVDMTNSALLVLD